MRARGRTLTALLTGTVAGAALGTLLAPDKGSKTRTKLAHEAGKLVEGIRQKGNESIKSLNQLKDQAIEMVGAGSEKRQSRPRTRVSRMKKVTGRVRRTVSRRKKATTASSGGTNSSSSASQSQS